MLIPILSIEKVIYAEIVKLNDITKEYGLCLSNDDVRIIINTKNRALNENGRVEFGGEIISKIIENFYTSPYITKQNYSDIINELVEIFYYYKNETMDQIGDDELINIMKEAFNGVCKGSIELLSGRELYKLSRRIKGVQG